MFNACDQLRLSLEIMLNEKYIRYRNQKDWQNSFYVYEPKSFLITQTPSHNSDYSKLWEDALPYPMEAWLVPKSAESLALAT